jgi:hypothetical protein
MTSRQTRRLQRDPEPLSTAPPSPSDLSELKAVRNGGGVTRFHRRGDERRGEERRGERERVGGGGAAIDQVRR